jgi:hypothetical protein
MLGRTDTNRVAVAVVIVVAMVAFLVPPLCEVSACGMPSGVMHHMHALGTSVECGMSAAYSATTAGVVPTRLDLGAVLAAMLIGAVIGYGPSAAVRTTALATARSGAPPPDPLGTRLLI